MAEALAWASLAVTSASTMDDADCDVGTDGAPYLAAMTSRRSAAVANSIFCKPDMSVMAGHCKVRGSEPVCCGV